MLEGASFDLVAEVAADCLELASSTRLSTVHAKSSNDYVTSVDLALQSLLRERLPKLVDLPVLSEEDDAKFDAAEGSYWMVDPLDGTNNFLFGLHDFATSVALVVQNRTTFGLLISHGKKSLIGAQISHGIKKLALVNEDNSMDPGQDSNFVGISTGFFRWTMKQEGDFKHAWEALSNEANFRNLGSQVMHAWHVVEGSFKASFSMESHIWDDLAARLVVEEAGGSWLSLRSLNCMESDQLPPSATATCYVGTKTSDALSKYVHTLRVAVQDDGRGAL